MAGSDCGGRVLREAALKQKPVQWLRPAGMASSAGQLESVSSSSQGLAMEVSQ